MQIANELLLVAHCIIVALGAIIMVRFGKAGLISYIGANAIIANLFVLKQIRLFGLNATAADVYIIGSVLGLNLLIEYYGKASALRAIWISFILLFFYVTMCIFHLAYMPSEFDFSQVYFSPLLQFMPRIALASIVAYVVVQHVDRVIYSELKHYFQSRFLVLRNWLSISFSQLIDTLLFGFLGLYGIVDNLPQIMLISYCIKMICIVLMVPLIALIRPLIHHK